ncbi:MAG: response regulator [Chloroflexi bacterium]|nr:response regulator [Chloroflexota bacterium]
MSPQTGNTHTANIMIAEDDPGTRTTLTVILEDDGHAVFSCENREEALKCISGEDGTTQIDIVVSDLRLPDLSGMEILTALKARFPDAAFILMSGYATLETAVQAVNQGAFSYHVKPLDIDSLMGTIRNALDQQRLISENKGLLVMLQRSNDELAEKNQLLEEAGLAKMQILSTASHELKTPLTSIVGYVDRMLLQRQTVGDLNDRQERYLEIVKRNSYRLKALVDDLLDISRIESGGIVLAVASIDVTVEIEDAVRSVQTHADRKNIEVEMDLPIDLPLVLAERFRFSQVIINLLSNACKYSMEGAKVTVSAAPHNGSVQFNVSDTGIGISEADQARLFSQFFQAETKLTREESGTGLGLFITKYLVEAHGGNIWVDSQEGVGTTFSFTIPSDTAVESVAIGVSGE